MFEDIRPYKDNEISAAMSRIAENPSFSQLSSFVFPHRAVDEIKEMVLAIDNIYDFQKNVMYKVNQRIIEETITELTYSGIERINPEVSYLYVSNHRDIMLDASLLQQILMENNLKTSEITFGANLMQGQLVIDIGKSNKMFKVERPGGSIREFYNASKHLSDYIRMTLHEKGESIWIAQRNGRTKNGIDRTDQGIINMFRMSGNGDKVQAIAELNIMPVAVSYEWEPCDLLKAMELYISNQHKGTYVKKEGEDLNSILTGIIQHKGKVHFAICKPIEKEELLQYAELSSNEFNRKVAELIDQRICSEFTLTANNYIAHDMLSGNEEYSSHYTPEEKESFIKHLSSINAYEDNCDIKELHDIMLGIYANPIKSKKQLCTDGYPVNTYVLD